MGLDLAAPLTGLPHANGLLTNLTMPDHVYQMAPSYLSNDVLFIGNYATNYANGPGFSTGTISNVTPATYTAVSILTSAGNGPVVMTVSINHADGTSESPFSTIDSPDWFNSAASSSNYFPPAVLAYIADGRVTPNGTLNNVNGGKVCELWSVDIPLSDTSPVTSVSFAYISGGRCCIFAISGQTATGGAFSPIALTGYDADAVVEAPPYVPYTATIDSGTNIAHGGGNTWFETGYAPSGPIAGPAPYVYLTNGIPAHASTFTTPAPYSRSYTMAPSYMAPDAILIDTNHQTINLQPQTPSAEAALSFLCSGGNIGGGTMSNLCVVQHADGTSETNYVLGYDWFNGNIADVAWIANGRLGFTTTAALGQPNNIGSPTSTGNDPRLFESAISLVNTTSPITNITLQYYNPTDTYGTGESTVILAVSASQKGVPVLIGPYTAAQNVYAGSNAYFGATLLLGGFPAYQWQFVTAAGVTNNLADGGNISGANTSILTISNTTSADLGYYQLVVTNSISTNVSAAAPLTFLVSTATNLTTPQDPITDFNNASGSPAGQTVKAVIDGALTPYVTSGPNGFSNAWGSASTAGYVITPNLGTSVATALRIYPGSGPTNGDPADIMLEGSNDGGNTFATILAQTSLALPNSRNNATGGINASNQVLQEVVFPNTTAYSTYRVTFHNIKDDTSTNGLEVAEVQILGGLAPLPPAILVQPNPLVYGFTGGTISFDVTPNGPKPFTYQWSFDGTAIKGATTAILALTNIPTSDVGSYSVTVSNAYGSIVSSNAVVGSLLPGNKFITAVLALKPLSFWPLQETNGTIAYDYAGTNDGTYNGGVTLAQPGVNLGSFGTNSFSALFDGSTGYVDIPGPGNLMITNSMSCLCWFLGLSPLNNGFDTIWGRSDNSWRVDYDNSGDPHFAMNNGTGDGDATSGTSIYDGRWHLIIGVYNAPTPTTGTNLLYVDGKLVATHAVPTPPVADTANLDTWIGGTEQYAGARNVNGYIAYCVVIDSAISALQISNLFVSAGAAPPGVTVPTNAFYGDENGTVTFTAAIDGGTPPFTYQWYNIDNTGKTNLLAGQTNITLRITGAGVGANSAQTCNCFNYFMVASNAFGSAATTPAGLNLYSNAPVLVTDLSTNVAEAPVDVPIDLFVLAYGLAPVTYQWYENGKAVPGATNSDYAFSSPSGSNTFSVTIANSLGTVSSSTNTIITPMPPITLNGGTNWTVNTSGSFTVQPNITGNTFSGTDGGGNEWVTAWFDDFVYINGFTATFTYQNPGDTGHDNADGASFTLQESGPAFIIGNNGNGGSGLGIYGLTPSVELEIDIYGGHTIGIAYTANGPSGPYLATGSVDVASGDPINFKIVYAPGGAAQVTLVDATTAATYSTTFDLGDLTTLLGSSFAFVGFSTSSGGTGGVQQFSDFNFSSTIPGPQLSIGSGPSGTVLVTWPLTTPAGFVLEASSSVTGPWANVTTTPTQVNGNYQISVTASGTAQFFQLVAP